MKKTRGVFIVAIAIAVVLCLKLEFPTQQAYALSQCQQQTNGVSVHPIQIARDNYGIAMIDTENEHIWIYELGKSGTRKNKLKLVAARSWKYDRQLAQYNTTEPTPQQVKSLLEKSVLSSIEKTEKQ